MTNPFHTRATTSMTALRYDTPVPWFQFSNGREDFQNGVLKKPFGFNLGHGIRIAKPGCEVHIKKKGSTYLFVTEDNGWNSGIFPVNPETTAMFLSIADWLPLGTSTSDVAKERMQQLKKKLKNSSTKIVGASVNQRSLARYLMSKVDETPNSGYPTVSDYLRKGDTVGAAYRAVVDCISVGSRLHYSVDSWYNGQDRTESGPMLEFCKAAFSTPNGTLPLYRATGLKQSLGIGENFLMTPNKKSVLQSWSRTIAGTKYFGASGVAKRYTLQGDIDATHIVASDTHWLLLKSMVSAGSNELDGTLTSVASARMKSRPDLVLAFKSIRFDQFAAGLIKHKDFSDYLVTKTVKSGAHSSYASLILTIIKAKILSVCRLATPSQLKGENEVILSHLTGNIPCKVLFVPT